MGLGDEVNGSGAQLNVQTQIRLVQSCWVSPLYLFVFLKYTVHRHQSSVSGGDSVGIETNGLPSSFHKVPFHKIPQGSFLKAEDVKLSLPNSRLICHSSGVAADKLLL